MEKQLQITKETNRELTIAEILEQINENSAEAANLILKIVNLRDQKSSEPHQPVESTIIS